MEEPEWLTERQVREVWPSARWVHGTALVHNVRSRSESWNTTTGMASRVYYHADDVRRAASRVAAAPPLRAPSQIPCCLAMVLVITGLIALLFWLL
ncbi:hypothetical protein [Streptomyces phaeoluteigriseus]